MDGTIERFEVGFKACRQVIRVDPVGPAVAELLFQRAPVKSSQGWLKKTQSLSRPEVQMRTGAELARSRNRVSLSRASFAERRVRSSLSSRNASAQLTAAELDHE